MRGPALLLAAALPALLPAAGLAQSGSPPPPSAYEGSGDTDGDGGDEPLIGPPAPAEPNGGGRGQAARPPPEPGRREGRGIEYGAHLLAPFWSTSYLPGERLRPGVGIRGRLGWEFARGFETELQLGYIRNVLDVSEETSISNLWVGAGVRYPFLNPTAFVPFLGAAVQIGFWDQCEPRPAEDAVLCKNRDPAVAFEGTLGLVFEISKKVALEGGVSTVVSLEGDVFRHAQLYMMPFLGLTLYY